MSKEKIDNPLEKERLRNLRKKLSWIMGIFVVIPIASILFLSPHSPFFKDSERMSEYHPMRWTLTFVMFVVNFLWLGVVWILLSKPWSPLVQYIDRKYRDDYEKTYVGAVIAMCLIEAMIVFTIFVTILMKMDYIIFDMFAMSIGYMGTIGQDALRELGQEKIKHEKIRSGVNRMFWTCLILPVIFYIAVSYFPHLLEKIMMDDDGGFSSLFMFVFCGVSLGLAIITQLSKPSFGYRLLKDMYKDMPGIEEYPEIVKAQSTLFFAGMAEIFAIIIYSITGDFINRTYLVLFISILLAFYAYSRMGSARSHNTNPIHSSR